ncbi:MAG: aminopeptidase [Proteobacteria bacterium]|nr:aminopeptidase [Pseudomonadota bacterium]
MPLKKSFLLFFCLAVVGGCDTLGYYSQAVFGQLGVLKNRQSVERLINDPLTDRELVRQLMTATDIVAFAQTHIGLPAGRRYQLYVDLEGQFVVWNLFAAPELSLEPLSFCHPFVGCTPYRGYFNEDKAQTVAAQLQAEGCETYTGGVRAYSTLGWFADPLMSSFINEPAAELADLLIHELAHSQVWVPGDVTFNESFASFVGKQGAHEWLEHTGLEAHDFDDPDWVRMRALLIELRSALAEVFADASDLDEVRRQRKAQVLAEFRRCYTSQADRYGGERFERLVDATNNALLSSLATYNDHIPAFEALWAASGEDWQAFFSRVESLARLSDADRALELTRSGKQEVTDAADDHHAEEVQCHALLRHGAG